MQTIISLILLCVCIYITYDRLKPVKGLTNLNEAEIKKKLKRPKDVVLIDVRQPYEYKAKHLPGAINVPISHLKRKNEMIPEDKEIILYCQTGIRSKNAARMIKKKHKVSSISHLKGGLYEWEGMIDNKKSKSKS
ncbi:rhodanese-like domain-containing protein [Litchfieldia alkalitelluris]|uniref:rhodanese-like domain-containing protein n=1 Tax=Litchfieldia alkalitelluris TaxID=304268 RepID=UPI00147464D6|nr:rhodanese-like domain-containing protein [Litchfieldia alkalitelluris]